MGKKNYMRAVLMAVPFAVVSCGGGEKGVLGTDQAGAEVIYTPSVTEADEGFRQVVEYGGGDGSRCVSTMHETFAFSEHHCLYSPAGNLRIVATCASETCALSALIIDYDSLGRVTNVREADSLPDEEKVRMGCSDTDSTSTQVMRRWLTEAPSTVEYPVRRDSQDNVVSVGAVGVPDGYRARYYIDEWGPFWTSDLRGGEMAFFVMLEKAVRTDGSYVNYLYCNDSLVAELAYWRGVLIKARTYNYRGVMVKQYDDRDIDLNNVTYWDYREGEPTWYVE